MTRSRRWLAPNLVSLERQTAPFIALFPQRRVSILTRRIKINKLMGAWGPKGCLQTNFRLCNRSATLSQIIGTFITRNTLM